MNAIEYFKQRKRMTKVNKNGLCKINCSECPLDNVNNGMNYTCHQLERLKPEKAIAIVEQWAQEHPEKTYLMDFLEKFPNVARMDSNNNIPMACRKSIYNGISDKRCLGGCEKCWNEVMDG